MFKQNPIYSIRKTKLGVFSAKIAIATFLLFAGGAVVQSSLLENSIVYADEVLANPATTENTVITSPVDYIADPTKEVGTRETRVTGTSGELTVTDTTDGARVERTEPTKTEVVLGTKPSIEVTEEKVKTDYVADPTLEVGKKETVTEPKNGTVTTTTNYKIVTKPAVDLGKEVTDALNSDKYMYTDEAFYHIDNSKSLPSDKVVIDKLYVKVPDNQTIGEKTGVREMIQDAVFTPTDGVYKDKALTPEMFDPENKEIRKLKEEDATWSWDQNDYVKYTWDYSKDQDFYESAIVKNGWNIIRLSLGTYVMDDLYHNPGAPITQAQSLKHYHAKHHITDSMYADAKASYLRIQEAATQVKDTMADTVKNRLQVAEQAFKSITQHYNNLNGYDQVFEPTYKDNDISESFKQDYKEDIAKLPYEIRKNLVNVLVTSGSLSADKTSTAAGFADSITRTINLSTLHSKDLPRDQRRLLLIHELGHIVDYNSGLQGWKPENWKDYLTISAVQAGFSASEEFQEYFNKYMKTSEVIDPYFGQNAEEAFAEGFGQYVNKHVFGVPFDHYKKVNGVSQTITPGQAGYEDATTPYDQMEPYFAKLYHQLFEQKEEASVLVDTIQTSKVASQNGLVKVGTKPSVEVIADKAKTRYVADPELESGMQVTVKEGKDGSVTTTTTYKLITKPAVDLGKDVTDALKSDKYMYTDEAFYHIDNSKSLPSDKVVIDKLYVQVPENQTIGEKTGVREMIQDAVFTPTDGVYKDKALTPEMLDPYNQAIRKLKENYNYFYFEDYDSPNNKWVYDNTWDYSKDKDFYESTIVKNAWNINRLSLGTYVSDDLFHTTAPVTQDQAVKNYNAKHHLSASMYADAKASYLRMVQAADKLKELGQDDNSMVKERLNVATQAFKSITQHYNALNGSVDAFKPDYVGDDLDEEFKQNYIEDISKLPYEIRKNLVNLFVSSKPLPSAAKTSNAAGIAEYVEKMIKLKHTSPTPRWVLGEDGQGKWDYQKFPRSQYRLLLIHELGHIIDFNSGLGNLGETFDTKDYFGPNFNYAGLSTTPEFRDYFEKYMKTNTVIDPYFGQNPEEAFAEGFGQYVNKRVFGVPFDHYKYVEALGSYGHFTIFPGEPGYDEATTPYDQMEPYFEKLYNQLFEQPVEVSLVVDTVTTRTVKGQDGLVKVGTKPVISRAEVAYTSIERGDESLPIGIRKVIRTGRNGSVLRTLTTQLVNAETGEVLTSTEEQVLSEMVPELVLVGTKREAASMTVTEKHTEVPVTNISKPATPKPNQLPKTGTDVSLVMSLIGAVGTINGLLFLKRKKHEE